MADIIECAEPSGFEAVDGTWQFDLDFYREIGLNLAPLEDPSETAAMPRLRRAAGLFVATETSTKASPDQQERARTLLLDAHSAVGQLMRQALRGISYDGIDEDHPAVVAWKERDPEAARRQCQPNGPRFNQLDWIYLGLVRERMPDIDSDTGTAKYVPIVIPGTNHYRTPTEVASQLTLARAGVWWDI